MKVELVEPVPVKKDVLLHLSNREAEELCTFLGYTSVTGRKDICSTYYDDSVICNIFHELKKIVNCR